MKREAGERALLTIIVHNKKAYYKLVLVIYCDPPEAVEINISNIEQMN